LDVIKKKNNTFLIGCHSTDYSNALVEKYKNSHEEKKNDNFIVYLDDGCPYFKGDTLLNGRKLPRNDTEKWYKTINLFFDSLENSFKSKILVVPHPKYKIPSLREKNLIPYFSNRLSDNSYNAAAKFIPQSLFVISRGSTAVSHAIINYKPIQLIYSSSYNYVREEYEDLFVQGDIIGTEPIDIDYYKEEKLLKNLQVDRIKYDKYKFKYLTNKNNSDSEKPNYRIIQDIMDKSI